LFGPIGREVLAAGTLIFLIFGLGGQLLAGQIALASLSDQKLCNVLYTGTPIPDNSPCQHYARVDVLI
jgi:hypothetical protein